jgi:hypothetical protein
VSNDKSANYINHVAVVMDGSGSMGHLRHKVIEVVDKLVAHLATRSKEMNQETRITIYVFDDVAECVYFDMDALRLPSVKDRYWVRGMTAMVDATMLAIEDLELTAVKYGDHSFLIYVVTDGRENRSTFDNKIALPGRIKKLPDNWTMGILVPDATGIHEAKRFGFPAGNIATWDRTSEAGLEEAVRVVTASVNTYMDNRSSGIVGTKSLFSTDASVLNAQTVAAAGLQPVDPATYMLVPVIHQMPILDFVENHCGRKYVVGTCFYQLNKSEIIQGHKVLYVQDKKSGLLYGGPQVRDLIGLGHEKRRVSPSFNKDYNIFVQSTSLNRNLVPSTHLMIKTNG